MAFREYQYSLEPKEGQDKTANAFTVTTVCRTFTLDVIHLNYDKNVIRCNVSLGGQGFPKNYGMDSLYRLQTIGKDNLQLCLCNVIQQNK